MSNVAGGAANAEGARCCRCAAAATWRIYWGDVGGLEYYCAAHVPAVWKLLADLAGTRSPVEKAAKGGVRIGPPREFGAGAGDLDIETEGDER